MTEETITYETLYDTLRREKGRVELQKLDEIFYENTIKYMDEKKEILKSQEQKESIFTSSEVQKTRKQIENIQKIIKELYELRESKLIQLAIIASKTKSHTNNKENMLKEEEKFYQDIVYTLDSYRTNLLNNLVCGKKIVLEETKTEPKGLKNKDMPTKTLKSIEFIKEVPSFVGTDLNIYGPFEKQNKAEIPLEIANLLIKTEKAIENENT